MLWNKDKLFCDINPTCYAISSQKKICKRHMEHLLDNEKYAKTITTEALPNLIFCHRSNLIKKGKGINLELQENKAVNIELACGKIKGIIIHPGEMFSFWKLVEKVTKRKGNRDGRVLINNRLQPGLGRWPLQFSEYHTSACLT